MDDCRIAIIIMWPIQVSICFLMYKYSILTRFQLKHITVFLHCVRKALYNAAVLLYTVSKINTSTQNTRQTMSVPCVLAVYISVLNRGPLFWVSSECAFSLSEQTLGHFRIIQELNIIFESFISARGLCIVPIIQRSSVPTYDTSGNMLGPWKSPWLYYA